MNGAESLVAAARRAGVGVCFANPGTTEMHLVAALDAVPGMRAVLGLFEGVCTGAADGYGRMTGRPALVLLHLGPGLANGIANLHNARRARSPVVVLVGDHATWHLPFDPPLASDIESLARPVSQWVRRSRAADTVAADVTEAIAAATGPPGGVATVILPQDVTWDDVTPSVDAPAVPAAPVPSIDVDLVARALRDHPPAMLLVGGNALGRRGLAAAARVTAATGCRVAHETLCARLERGRGLPAFERLPYFPEQLAQVFADVGTVVLAGAASPVSFFGYRDMPSTPIPSGTAVVTLAAPDDDAALALEALADSLGAAKSVPVPAREPLAPPSGRLTPDTLGQAVAALQPDGAIVVDESATSGLPYFERAASAPPHALLMLTGGAIGQGLPCAVGAAIACPDRRVIALHGDGGAMYTLQALWTMAREQLAVTTIICANRAYRILSLELARAGTANPGPQAERLTTLAEPALDWTALAGGMGVPAARVTTADELVRALARSFDEPGPWVIEAVL
jgi:acetolactate synthase-1/2/3 large subunit